MKFTVTFAAILSALLMAASVASAVKPVDVGSGGKSAAAKACAAEKKADKAAFQEKYGKHAMRNCIKGIVDEVGADEGASTAELKNAAKECKAEQAADPAAFAEKYGTNKNGKNAFGKCVSSKVDDDEADEDEDEVEDEEDEEESEAS